MSSFCQIFRFVGIGFQFLWIVSLLGLGDCHAALQGTICNDKLRGNVLLGENQICCGNSVHNDTDDKGNKLQCCHGKDLFDPKERECCGSQLLKFDDNLRCCKASSDGRPSKNDAIIDKRKKQFCCNNVVTQLPYYSDLDDYMCCGTTYFNKKVNSCCKSSFSRNNQSILVLKENETCCGTSKYNTDKEWCTIDEKVLMLGEDLCGTRVFKVNEEVCCNKTIGYVKKIPSEISNCTPDKGCSPKCKHGRVFNSKTHEWNDVINDIIPIGYSICGKDVYDPEKKECCNNTRLHDKVLNHVCCGDSYTDIQLCCYDQVINPTVQACCNAIVITRSPELKCCEDTLVYNPIESVCCKSLSRPSTIIKRKANDTTCCSKLNPAVAYNNFDEICTENGIKKKDNSIPGTDPVQMSQNEQNKKPEIRKKPKRSFCGSQLKRQIKKTCNKRRSINAYIVDVDESKRNRPILHVIILFPKSLRGLVGRWRVNKRAKCLKSWDNKFVWLFTNRRHKGRNTTLRITNRDLLFRDTTKNKERRSRLCRQQIS